MGNGSKIEKYPKWPQAGWNLSSSPFNAQNPIVHINFARIQFVSNDFKTTLMHTYNGSIYLPSCVFPFIFTILIRIIHFVRRLTKYSILQITHVFAESSEGMKEWQVRFCTTIPARILAPPHLLSLFYHYGRFNVAPTNILHARGTISSEPLHHIQTLA